MEFKILCTSPGFSDSDCVFFLQGISSRNAPEENTPDVEDILKVRANMKFLSCSYYVQLTGFERADSLSMPGYDRNSLSVKRVSRISSFSDSHSGHSTFLVYIFFFTRIRIFPISQ